MAEEAIRDCYSNLFFFLRRTFWALLSVAHYFMAMPVGIRVYGFTALSMSKHRRELLHFLSEFSVWVEVSDEHRFYNYRT